MKKLKNIAILSVSWALIFMFASYLYSKALFEERRKEVKTFTEAQLEECIKQNEEKRSARYNSYTYYDDFIHLLPTDASDRELLEAQCLYEDEDVGRKSNCSFNTKVVAPPHASYFLPAGTIFGIHSSKGKFYQISDESPLFLDVFAKKLMSQTTCFKTTEEAEAAGYIPYSE